MSSQYESLYTIKRTDDPIFVASQWALYCQLVLPGRRRRALRVEGPFLRQEANQYLSKPIQIAHLIFRHLETHEYCGKPSVPIRPSCDFLGLANRNIP